MINTASAQLIRFQPGYNTAFVRAMYKKWAGNDKQGKDAGNRTLCPYRNFSQAIMYSIVFTHNVKILTGMFCIVQYF